jgi:hypothetical protein
MSLGTLAVIGICGLAGPLLAEAGRGAVPVVVGEILAGSLSATPACGSSTREGRLCRSSATWALPCSCSTPA